MNKHKEIFLKDYRAPEFTILQTNLEFDIFDDYTIVTNKMSVKRLDINATLLKLNGENLELLSLSYNDKDISLQDIEINETSLAFGVSDNEFTIHVTTKIYPHKNTELEGLYKSGGIFCTQNEPEGFRKITYFLDRPDVMAKYTTKITADKRYPILLSNGNKKQSGDIDENRHFCIWEDPFAKPSYLFAVVVGDLGSITDSFTTMSGRDVELNIYCDKGNEDKCFHAMESLKKAMKWDEQQYKREYDLEIYNIVAVDSFNMGAMENKGLNIFNSHYVLADAQSATDGDYMGIQSVIAHEYFHNWTGNRITCKEWFELTLKEGLTVYRDQCFSADMNSKDVVRIDNVKRLKENQFIEDSGPTAHPIQPKSYISMNNFYTATVYEKGAEVIRMYNTLLGEQNYKKSMQLYFDTFDGRAVTIDDFFWAMQKSYEGDLTQFKRWYHQSGTPVLELKDSYDNGTLTLTCKQIIPKTPDGKEQFAMMYPLRIALFYADAELAVEKTLVISKSSHKFVFDDLKSRPYLSVNRGFSAPVKIVYANEDYPFLMKYDTDSYNRYEAAENFALKTINMLIDTKELDRKYLNSFGELLNSDTDLMYKAKLCALPEISAILQTREVLDFEKICNAHEVLALEIATLYQDRLLQIYHSYNDLDNNHITSAQMGKRAIKNRALWYLAFLQNDDIKQLCKAQYYQACTMTDKIFALSLLSIHFTDIFKPALDNFYQHYSSNTLVMTKYFSIIAMSHQDNLISVLNETKHDSAYDELVPNFIRALFGSFTRNYRFFHAKDGSGYKFLADEILKLDKINPQISSSLAGAFKIYKKLDANNKQLVEIELKRILNEDELSDNCYEIIQKIINM